MRNMATENTPFFNKIKEFLLKEKPIISEETKTINEIFDGLNINKNFQLVMQFPGGVFYLLWFFSSRRRNGRSATPKQADPIAIIRIASGCKLDAIAIIVFV